MNWRPTIDGICLITRLKKPKGAVSPSAILDGFFIYLNLKIMWNSDNPIFNVNGCGINALENTLKLAIGEIKIVGWQFINHIGLVLYSLPNAKMNKFPTPLSASNVTPIVFNWLESDQAKTVPLEGWDRNADHDGSNELGWRVFTEGWGHVNNERDAIAIKPAYMWYGK